MNNIHSTIHEMHFNSRPSARGDEKIISALEKKVISIHAPPRGATPTRTAASGRPEYFNSRPSARGDRAPDEYVFASDNFNSRPSARGDAAPPPNRRSAAYFNSRPSARGDPFRGREVLFRRISIHAPPRGATRSTWQSTPSHKFQFTPLREGRQAFYFPFCRGYKFQFTPLREGRRQSLCERCHDEKFQFTPLREGRLPFCVLFSCFLYFNSRPSARGDCYQFLSISQIYLFQFTPLREGRPCPAF